MHSILSTRARICSVAGAVVACALVGLRTGRRGKAAGVVVVCLASQHPVGAIGRRFQFLHPQIVAGLAHRRLLRPKPPWPPPQEGTKMGYMPPPYPLGCALFTEITTTSLFSFFFFFPASAGSTRRPIVSQAAPASSVRPSCPPVGANLKSLKVCWTMMMHQMATSSKLIGLAWLLLAPFELTRVSIRACFKDFNRKLNYKTNLEASTLYFHLIPFRADPEISTD